jgi:hypothetical protein
MEMRSNFLIFLLLAATVSGCADHYAQLQAINRSACDNDQTGDCSANGSADQSYRAGQQRLNNQLNRQINGP